MATLLVQKTSLLITCGVKAVKFNVEGDSRFQQLDISNVNNRCLNENANCDGVKEGTASAEVHIVAADISSCEKYVALCTSDKHLSLWKTDNLSLISNRTLARVASKVRFVPSGRAIVLADKSGDAYSFSAEKPYEDGQLLLGHLSMLLDILVSPDEKYIITCDRDEKIRVSQYPNTYNIKSYCLGHKEFITGLSLLPADKTVLISSSGDGTIRFWDYKAGIQLHVVDCNGSVCANKDIVEHSNKSYGGCVLPVRLVGCSIDTTTSLICTCISKLQGCIVYQVKSISKNITANLMHILKLQAEPWDISLTSQGELWILGPFNTEPLSVFMWDFKVCQFVACKERSVVLQVNSRWDLFQSVTPTILLPLLYKRKFDNIQIYQERKRQRLSGILASSCSNTLAE
ncbi:tRNA (guanine-N(7)-)-methyltransferase non-catalytic subunit WDR4 [Zootermopsis nevadensis]|uniref:tRNA (Guanine-N(7)-)-methyltransferase subunit WDR4 n=1 Tax=Zootermopsis nevadensis TaxID=136037 RepID=A0A067QVS8_ZOONE|nr:tRNA (guanine-N(7)-)-methyltransferase non-catalytic subunit WDR4 [Zootermopsis nevadensis]KDR13295.1 tRNA (guanine-N(7)-)-methyltransferase subunit WDR4 [Zootermopsis nevadensis]